MNKKFSPKPLATIVFACASTISGTATAVTLEEIVVTAQKRAESMQDVPIAVTAMNADMLKKAGISNVKGVAVRTPGFSMGEFNPTQPQMYIRGIGSNGDGAASGEGSVAMFIDGAYVNRSSGAGMELVDIESIEVLRGPQGTLWGKNAIAGAINVTTKKPADILEAQLEATAGSYGLSNYRGMITGPISDSVNGKISFNQKDRDGYIESVIDPDVEQGSIDSSSLRGQLLFTPIDTLEALLTIEYGEDRRSGVASRSDDTLLEPAFFLNGATMAAAHADGVPVADFHENYANYEGKTAIDTQGISLKVDWDIDIGTITSLTSYNESKASTSQAGSGISSDLFLTYGPLSGMAGGLNVINFIDENTEIFSQEFRLTGDTDNLTWQTGIYYNSENIHRIEGNYVNAFGFLAGAGFNPYQYGESTSQSDQRNETTSMAIFGQATYSLTEDLDITLGLRYTEETKDYVNLGSMTPHTDPSAPVLEDNWDGEKTWRAPTYKLVANYHITDGAMAYISAATGFKSGGFSYSSPLSPSSPEPFNEKNALNLELGFKTMLLEDRLRLNGAIFKTDYEDLQVLQQFDCGGCALPPLVTKNAGKAVSQGIELEAMLAVTDNLQLAATYAYLDAEYKELDGSLVVDEGNTLRNAPRNAYSLTASYEKDLTIGGFINARLEYLHKEKTYQDTANHEFATMPEYRTFNGRLAYTSADEKWEVAGWVNNMFGEEYYLHNYQAPPFGATHVAAMPRTYGVTVTWSQF
jgi:iron complex outermembrane recepter protein